MCCARQFYNKTVSPFRLRPFSEWKNPFWGTSYNMINIRKKRALKFSTPNPRRRFWLFSTTPQFTRRHWSLKTSNGIFFFSCAYALHSELFPRTEEKKRSPQENLPEERELTTAGASWILPRNLTRTNVECVSKWRKKKRGNLKKNFPIYFHRSIRFN